MYTKYRDNRYREKEKKRESKAVFKGIPVGAGTKRSKYTMACRFLDTSLPSSQKAGMLIWLPLGKNSLCSSYPFAQRSLSASCSHLSSALTDADDSMTIVITSTLWRWLTDSGLEGFIKVAEAPPLPDSMDTASKLHIDTITNAMIRKKLGLNNTGENATLTSSP